MRNITLWTDRSAFTPWRNFFDEINKNWVTEMDFHPACDIEETELHFLMSLDVHGVSKNDIQVEVKEDQLVVSGERKKENKGEGTSERVYGKFSRIVQLPNGLNAEKIEAHYQDGVLTITIPKSEA